MAAPVLERPVAASRVTLAEFRAMDLDHHAELLLGEVFPPMPESFRHLEAADAATDFLNAIHAPKWVLRDAPLPILDDGMPRPDALVLAEPKTVYRARGGYDSRDALLVVEVCLNSYDRDYRIKDQQYALGNVPEYWIVDLEIGHVEVRTDPQKWGYARRHVYGPGESVAGIAVDDLLTQESPASEEAGPEAISA